MHTIYFGQIFWGQNSENQKKTIKKIVVSAELPKTKHDIFFFEKCAFDMGEKVGFTNCVFEKVCPSENTSFIVLSAKHSCCNKNCMF